MKLIVGLGNPGAPYQNTRHNAGFQALDFLEGHFGFPAFRPSQKHDCELAEGVIGEEKALMIKPLTYMNLSGRAVRSVTQFYKISPNDMVVIYDDVSIPSGNLRVRPMGSAGGHKGVQSIIQEIGTEDFTRVRLGIGPLTEFRGSLENYVLGKFSDEESVLMTGNFKKLHNLLESLFANGVEQVMNEYN